MWIWLSCYLKLSDLNLLEQAGIDIWASFFSSLINIICLYLMDCSLCIGHLILNRQCNLVQYKFIYIFHFFQIWSIYYFETRLWVSRYTYRHHNTFKPILGTDFNFWYHKEMDSKDQFHLKSCIQLECK